MVMAVMLPPMYYYAARGAAIGFGLCQRALSPVLSWLPASASDPTDKQAPARYSDGVQGSKLAELEALEEQLRMLTEAAEMVVDEAEQPKKKN
jgi:hypothetical protein